MRLVALLVALHISGSGVSSFGLTPAMRTTSPRQSLSRYLFNPSSSAPKRTADAVAVARGRRRSRLVGGERPQRRCGAQAGSSSGEGIGADDSDAQPNADGGSSSSGDGDGKPISLVARLGTAGLVSYGVLNGLWYSGGIAFVMLGPMGAVPAGSGIEGTIAASVKQLGKVIGLVWLGSQATKPLRLALAALTAPAADRLIASTQRRLGLNKKDAVSLLVAAIFGSTAAFCLAVVTYGVARAAMVSTVAPAGPPSSSAAILIRRRMMKDQQ
ncbi:unnamed protein product [Ectocarpus sp. CCAP 1310/34]|nr:unnamed protein product [Ectocarpus sp. CCAP 1310/34]